MKIGIFIKGSKELHNKIYLWKEIIKKNFQNNDYADHLIHSTILVADINNYQSLTKDLESIKYEVKNKFSVKKTEIFWNDPITKKNTLVFLIKKNKNLNMLQNILLQAVKKYLIKNLDNHLNNKKLNKNMKKNISKYGYPFINKDWKPHFTVGSINAYKNNEIYKRFYTEKINYNVDLQYIEIYKINKNSHKLIKKIRLNA